jgi:3-oxoacyl-[acyl-carrier-protein] synthase I
MPSMRDCYFTGAALHTSMGCNISEHLTALQSGPAKPQQATAEFADKSQTLPYKLLAGTPLHAIETRLHSVLYAVVRDAIAAAGLTNNEQRRLGLFLGTSSFDVGVSEHRYRDALKRDANALAMDQRSSLGTLGVEIRQHFDLRGPDYSFNTACTASANALVYADAMVRSGQLDHALVVGVETFNAITALGFHGLQLLTPTAMQPFSRERNGLILGEGCSALVLSHRAQQKNNFQLIGSGNLCDTYGMSAANPDGSTVSHVIEQALQRAGLAPLDIAAIKTHGTASLSNDEAEAAGMRRSFTQMPPVTALKPYLGHTLGACGLNELLCRR